MLVRGLLPGNDNHFSVVGQVEAKTDLEHWFKKVVSAQKAAIAGNVPGATDNDKTKIVF